MNFLQKEWIQQKSVNNAYRIHVSFILMDVLLLCHEIFQKFCSYRSDHKSEGGSAAEGNFSMILKIATTRAKYAEACYKSSYNWHIVTELVSYESVEGFTIYSVVWSQKQNENVFLLFRDIFNQFERIS